MSATGNPRNKVALQPGHSLMDWIRLGNSGEDLAGTGGVLRSVTKEELASHNTSGDVWLCIRGLVYNVTRYVNFHPGGVDELMKGAGIDATTLFNQVHPWVNYEGILKKCLVGRLVHVVDDDVFSLPTMSAPKKPVTVREADVGPLSPKSDWYQQMNHLTLVVYLKEPINQVYLDKSNGKELWVNLLNCWMGWELISPVKWPPTVILTDSKLEIKLNKEQSAVWDKLQKLEPGLRPPPPPCIECSIKSIQELTHNVYLISLESNDHLYFHVPLGYHISLRGNIKGVTVERPYTPVCGLLDDLPTGLHFIVKCYPDGLFSSWLTSRKVNEVISVTQPVGLFNPKDLSDVKNLILLAAGTGITPMIRLIQWALQPSKRVDVKLIFFNKAEKDIIWKDKLEALRKRNSRFVVEHILSDGGNSWDGKKGWITLQLLQSLLPDFTEVDLSPYYVCVCGPVSFTQLTERYLQDMGYTNSKYFCFRG